MEGTDKCSTWRPQNHQGRRIVECTPRGSRQVAALRPLHLPPHHRASTSSLNSCEQRESRGVPSNLPLQPLLLPYLLPLLPSSRVLPAQHLPASCTLAQLLLLLLLLLLLRCLHPH